MRLFSYKTGKMIDVPQWYPPKVQLTHVGCGRGRDTIHVCWLRKRKAFGELAKANESSAVDLLWVSLRHSFCGGGYMATVLVVLINGFQLYWHLPREAEGERERERERERESG